MFFTFTHKRNVIIHVRNVIFQVRVKIDFTTNIDFKLVELRL
jgi:hypothetical protein